MKRIPLTQGQFALVDDADYEWLSQHKWCAQKVKRGFYARRSVWDGERQQHVYMHRLILDAPKGIMVDHIDGNPLNNQRSNIRLANGNGNYQNKPGWGRGRYKGVCKTYKLKDGTQMYVAYCAREHLGTFDTEEEAASAYNQAASKKFGEFAKLNVT